MAYKRTVTVVTAFILLLAVGLSTWRVMQHNNLAPTARFNSSDLTIRLRRGPRSGDDLLEIYVFLDLSQTASRQMFSRFEDPRSLTTIPYPVSVNFVHFPGALCSTSNTAACKVAVAVECAEKLKPGIGLFYLRKVHEYQWTNEVLNVDELISLAKTAEFDTNDFRRCLTKENKAIIAEIDFQRSRAAQSGLDAAPAIWMRWAGSSEKTAFLGPELDPTALQLAARCLVDNTCPEVDL